VPFEYLKYKELIEIEKAQIEPAIAR
jgi:hypothetical protein